MTDAPHPYLDWPGPIAFAHRGGAAEVPENTMRAFGHAIDLGYRYIETDVQVSADGVVMVFHDDDLMRTCERPDRVDRLSAAELTNALVHGSEPIPTLDEVLETWPDLRLNIDCKSEGAVEPLVATLRRHQAFDRVCVASFDDRRIRHIRRLAGPSLCTGGAMRELAALWGTGRISRRSAPHAAQVPVRQRGLTVVTPRFLRRCRRLGVAVHVWTIDEPAEMHRLLDAGVDGIITDRPSELRDVLVERSEWVS